MHPFTLPIDGIAKVNYGHGDHGQSEENKAAIDKDLSHFKKPVIGSIGAQHYRNVVRRASLTNGRYDLGLLTCDRAWRQWSNLLSWLGHNGPVSLRHSDLLTGPHKLAFDER